MVSSAFLSLVLSNFRRVSNAVTIQHTAFFIMLKKITQKKKKKRKKKKAIAVDFNKMRRGHVDVLARGYNEMQTVIRL